MTVCVVWDISEKIDDFLEKQAPLKAIVFDYYFNFIPYFASMLSPLFVFIAVIFFTAKMANNTEFVAILSSGISFRRILLPYFIAAALLASISFYFSGWVIPHANQVRLEFESRYIKTRYYFNNRNIHRQISPGEFIYFESYNGTENAGYKFSLEKIQDGKLYYKLMSDFIRWDTTSHKWKIENYLIREIDGMHEKMKKGVTFDTTLAFFPEDFNRRINNVETMDNKELKEFINQEQLRGTDNIEYYQIEKYKRTSVPFATFILTLIGVSLASRKVRGGIGMQIVFGLVLSFIYIFFMQVANVFSTNGGMSPFIAVWIPNIIFTVIGLALFRYAPK